MKMFISKTKDWARAAAELKKAMEQVPPTLSQIRQTVAQTADQLQHLRGEVQSSVAELKADNEGRLSEALQEINLGMPLFLEAGYSVTGVNLEISPVERLVIHLRKEEELPRSALRALINQHRDNRTVHAILSALLQGEAMAEKLTMPNMQYTELIIGIGPSPNVRLCWRPIVGVETVTANEHISQPSSQSVMAESTPPTVLTEGYGPGSFFERRSSVPVAQVAQHTGPAWPISPAAREASESEAPSGRRWQRETLDHYKNKPHYSKYRK